MYAHASAFTCSGCAAIRDSNCIPLQAGCAGIQRLVQADPANNTLLTAGINAAWNSWSRSDKANFASYKKRIESIVYDQNPDWDNGIKTEQVSKILDGYAPDGSAAKDLILAIQIAGWGSLCDYLNCAIRGFYMLGDEKNCGAFTTTTSATTSTTWLRRHPAEVSITIDSA
ncbi:hypothetical protein AAVH_29540 [Aphelenchoides avenae]|nr:hypothetical protein AAVH_35351 [Aphelenchus avenae]KAH7703290.1 hypothetical protein AAVH_29540 [Aphelenchus avenae]